MPKTTLADRLRQARLQANLEASELNRCLILGPGWIEAYENGSVVPSVPMLLAIARCLDTPASSFLKGITVNDGLLQTERAIVAQPADGGGIKLVFRYSKYDAVYKLPSATLEGYEQVLSTLRDGLAQSDGQGSSPKGSSVPSIRADSVARAFLKAVEMWPKENPSDIWYFLISRAFCDPFNHPADFARMDLAQSWKRTGGWALERILVQHYAPHLQSHGIRLFIADSAERKHLLGQVKTSDKLEPDKADVLLTGDRNGVETLFGVVHVKASFAERRTDDVPMSRSLCEAGYLSPLWTMDCKSTPSGTPLNKGELGSADGGEMSAKRKDIEDDHYFSSCFSYNRKTEATSKNRKTPSRVYRCDFSSPDDEFSRFVIKFWAAFQPRQS